METKLVEYGIMQEVSDYRVHICFKEGYAYLFKTEDGRGACLSGEFRKVPAYQKGVIGKTAEGFIVPPMKINGCKRIKIPDDILSSSICPKEVTTTERGNAAVKCTRLMFKRGLIPIELDTTLVEDKDIQVQGIDIIIKDKTRIENKCDYDGGVEGTGNLYLQISERNPLRNH